MEADKIGFSKKKHRSCLCIGYNGKTPRKVSCRKTKKELEEKKDLSNNQFVFKKGRVIIQTIEEVVDKARQEMAKTIRLENCAQLLFWACKMRSVMYAIIGNNKQK